MCWRHKSEEDETEQTELQITELRRKQTVKESRIYEVEMNDNKLPIVYDSAYNIHFFGLEKMHPFDSKKWENVMNHLIVDGKLTKSQYIRPREVTHAELRVVHSASYLRSLNCSGVVARVVEIPFVACVPNCVVNRILLKPMRIQTGGTILAAHLALQRQFAINIGGGFHHASATKGGGFCVYADITLALSFLFLNERIKTAMIVDLDAHQGNGHEHDFANEDRVFILDMFNYQIYPGDFKAKGLRRWWNTRKRKETLESIKCAIRLESHTGDREYLSKLKKGLQTSLNTFTPDLIVYNAGTDVLDGDPLGRLDISAEGVVKRDEMVFMAAAERSIPIVMVTSGGYTSRSAEAIAESVTNLLDKFILPNDTTH
ncbi:Hist-deacetyl domain-containing protein [Aphelenchoides besseyi]|nr:Hist-deacetyl domain-containing protein [Aphelenchoides besseyi]KAI6202117.1 Hist-deacetyl domain-containing protein [Aphelenchoides besseyi]